MYRTQRIAVSAALFVTSLLSVGACTSSTTTSNPTTTTIEPTTSVDATGLAEQVTDVMQRELATFPTLGGELVAVLARSGDVDVEAVAGFDDARPPVGAGAAVRIASVTKTFTAAAVLRLVEDGALHLDDDLVEAGVPADLLDLLRSDGYAVDEITIAQLLDHTSGIADFAGNDTGVVGSAYGAAVLADPSHVWTRAEQVRFAVDHYDPMAEPGAAHHYSDTGYILLGAVVEARTGLTFGAALRELLDYQRLGLRSTYLEDGSDRPIEEHPMAAQRVGDIDLATLSPTIDLYGGGGIVSTMHDLATFYDALLGDRVFHDPATLATMTSVSDAAAAEHAASGLFEAHVGQARCWYHSGFWGVQVLTCPGLGLTVARSWGQAATPDGFDPAAALLEIVERAGAVA